MSEKEKKQQEDVTTEPQETETKETEETTATDTDKDTATENNSKPECEEKAKDDEKKDDVNEFEEKYNKLNDTHLRLRAEFDNYRKRAIKDKADLLKSANASLLVNILPLIDDFERGLEAAEKSEDINTIKKGMELIYNKFTTFLKQNGIKEIEAKDKDFDTDFHEAITTIPSPTEEQKGKVIDCVQKGYTLNDKVIRFSKVVVGK